MDITITGLGLGLTDRFQDYVTEKVGKIEHLLDRAIAFEVKVTRHHENRSGSGGDDRVELMVICPGPLVRAEASGSDKYVAFDLAMGKLAERIRTARDRKKVHRGQHRPVSLREASGDGFSVVDITPAPVDLIDAVATGEVRVQREPEPGEEGYSPVVIRQKVFPSSTMTVEDAVDHMELVGHDFFLFIDAATDRPSVVYRRKGWDYGVISLEEQTAAAAGGSRRASARS